MASPRKLYTQPQAGLQGFARTRKVFGSASCALLTTDLVTANSVAAFRIPAGFTITGINAVVPTLDSGVALTISIGDAAVNNRYVNASTVGRSPGGTINALAATGLYYNNPIDQDVLLTFPAGATTPVAGAITNFYLEGFTQFP